MSRRPTRGLLLLAALIIAVGTLSACGKKGELEPPPEKEETKRR